MRGLELIFGIITIAILVGVWVFQARVSQTVLGQVESNLEGMREAARTNAENEAKELSVETAAGGELTVLKEAGSRTPRDEILALVNTEHFSRERTLVLSQIIDLKALRDGDDVLPDDPKLRELWMTVRARRLSASLCEEVVASFARACKPRSEEIEGPTEAGHYVVTSTLSYRPAMPFGTLPDTEAVSFGVYELEPDDVEVVDVDPGEMATHRAQLFDLAAEACAEINAVYGNCGPLRLQARFKRERGKFRIGCREARDDPNACSIPRLNRDDLWVPRTAGDVELSVEVGYLQPPIEVAEGAQ